MRQRKGGLPRHWSESPPKARCKTITFDNGKEFADHAFMEKGLNAKGYFAQPYCAWESGLNENHNGRLRPYTPETMSLASITQIEVDGTVDALNHRPRNCLNSRRPHEVFHGLDIASLS